MSRRRHPTQPSALDAFYLFLSVAGPVVVLVLILCGVGPFG